MLCEARVYLHEKTGNRTPPIIYVKTAHAMYVLVFYFQNFAKLHGKEIAKSIKFTT